MEHQTEVRYKTLTAHAVDEFGETDIRTIASQDIDKFLRGFSIEGYSTKTIKDQSSIVKMIFGFAHIKNYIPNLPTFPKLPKGKNAVKREALTDEQIKTVQNSVNCTFGLLAYFLLYTGLRKSEALVLQYKDIDFENKLIHVNKALFYKGNSPHIKNTKTEAGERDVILLDCVVEKT